jgi:hypothetical protein
MNVQIRCRSVQGYELYIACHTLPEAEALMADLAARGYRGQCHERLAERPGWQPPLSEAQCRDAGTLEAERCVA